jgi:hypothetical protein
MGGLRTWVVIVRVPGAEQCNYNRRTLTARLWPLVGLLSAGVVIELCWVLLTPLSFRMTHGAEYTQTLLLAHPLLSSWLEAVLPLSTRLAPAIQQQSTYIDPQLNTLVGLFVVSSLAYLAAIVVLDRFRLPAWLVIGFGLVFQATVLLMPGFLTTDAFSYVMYGRISFIYRANPYLLPPGAFPNDPLLGWIHPAWVMQPSVYGPLWTDVGWLMAKLGSGLSLVDQVFSYKLLIQAAELVNLGLVWYLAGRIGPGRTSPQARLTAFALFAWNPLVVFELAGNAHNDGLMLTFLLLALAPLSAGFRMAQRPLVAMLLTLSALVKFTTGLVGLFVAAAWLRSRPRPSDVAAAAAGVLGLALVVSWRWLQGPDALQPLLAAAGGNFYGNSLVDLLANALGSDVWAKLVTRGLFLVYLTWELRQVWRASDPTRAVLQASVRGLLALLLLVLTWVLTWYFTWPLALAVFLGWRTRLTQVAVAFSLTCLPFIYLKHYWGDAMPDWLGLLYVVPPLLLAAIRRPSSRARTAPSGAPAAPPAAQSGRPPAPAAGAAAPPAARPAPPAGRSAGST